MGARTDLASESEYILNGTDLSGIEQGEQTDNNAMASISRIKIITPEAAEKIGRPCGRYLTLSLTDKSFESEVGLFNARAALLSKEIRALLPRDLSGGVLFAGIGNRRVTPDSVGPLCADRIFATRHIGRGILRSGLTLTQMSVISPGVLAQTGLESAELIRLIAGRIKPSAIIICDAFACSDIAHLGTTVSLCDTGISPGSGVNNSRSEISEATMGVPCIAAGIPTVADIGAVTDSDSEELKGMIVTPGRIDSVVSHGSALIALAVNLAVQPSLSAEEILSLIG